MPILMGRSATACRFLFTRIVPLPPGTYTEAGRGGTAVIDRLNKQAARLASDPESHSLVRAIIDDERSTLCALQEAAAASAMAA